MYKLIPFHLPLQILGHGRSYPQQVVSNIDLLKTTPSFAGKPDSFLKKIEERMIQNFGFKYRRMLKLPQAALHPLLPSSETYGIESALKALSQTKERPEILVHGTTTTSRYTGSQATAISGKLGLIIPSYETKAGCSTGLAGLHLAYCLMEAGYDSTLCVFSETLSKVVDIQNQESWFGLGDGSASLFLKKTKQDDSNFTVLKSVFFTDGEHINLYSTQGQLPPNSQDFESGGYVLKGDAEALRLQALRRYKDLITTLLSPDEKSSIKWIFCHQVSRQLIRDVMEQNTLNGSPYWINHDYGNIGGTTIPFSLSLALEENIFKSGDLILLMSVGGGISAAAQLWRWN